MRKHDFNIVKCNECGLVYVNPRATDEELVFIYQHDYFNNKEYGYVSYTQEKRLRIKNFERWLNDIKHLLPVSKDISALDIGCAAGYCLLGMKAKGYYAEGLELDESMYHDLIAAGYTVFQKTIEDFEPTRKYALVTMFDVIEHIPHIDSAFKRIYQLLENNGILVIVTPDYNSFQRKVFGRKWFQFKPIEHIQYFTKETLSIFANRNGFELISCSSSGQYADSEFIINRLKYYGFSFLSTFFKSIFSILRIKNKLFYTDTGSMLAVFKKKAISAQTH